jgi:hypothetical protein
MRIKDFEKLSDRERGFVAGQAILLLSSKQVKEIRAKYKAKVIK